MQRLAGVWEIADTTANIPHPYEEGMAESWIAGHADAFKTGEQVTFAITLHSSEQPLGAIGLVLDSGYQGELGYWIGLPYWGQGYCTEAGRSVVEYAFGELGLQRVFARALRRNQTSRRVLEKLGMRHEGTLRQHVLKWGKPEDVDMFGLLRAEYKPVSICATEIPLRRQH